MMKRILPLASWFKSSEWADALCPVCEVGALRADPAQEHESTATRDVRDHEAWEPEWINGFFTCVLRCQRDRCREITVAMGLWEVRESFDSWGPPAYSSYYRLQMTMPPLPIMQMPARCPEPVREAVASAARVVWVDPNAAASRLRVATELLLDAKRIPRSTRGAKLSPLKLHGRIDRLRAKNPSVAELLEAVKWIGNQGSHEDTLGVADVLEGAQVLEHALALLYDTAPADIRRRAMQINKAKRVRSARGVSRQ